MEKFDLGKGIEQDVLNNMDKKAKDKSRFITGTGLSGKPKTEFTCPDCGCVFGFKMEYKDKGE